MIDYTHVINIGANDFGGLMSAADRYTAGGADYVDPVAFDNVFEDIEGIPTLTFAPFMRVSEMTMGQLLRMGGGSYSRDIYFGRS